MNDGCVLEVVNVAKSYGRRIVLRDVTVSLNEGQIIGITGENGSGKSTLMKIIVGGLAPDHGHVIRRDTVGYCPQELAVFETLTVEENFAYFATAYGLVRKERPVLWRKRKGELLKRFRFEQYERKIVSTLSGGTKQKLNLSLAVLHEPSLLVLDEPYAGFDWETTVQFWDYAEELRVRGACVLIVSHFVYDRARFDGVYELREGSLRCG